MDCDSHVQEWNGIREVSEKRFEWNSTTVLSSVAYFVVPLVGFYALTRSELIEKDRLESNVDNERYL